MGAVNFWLDIVAAAYRLDVDDNAWLDGVAEVVRPRLDHGFGVYGNYYYAPSPDQFRAEPLRFYNCPSEVIAFAHRAYAATTPEVVRHVLLSHPFGTASDALGRPRLSSRLPPTAPPFGIADSVAVNAVDPVGNGLMLCGPMNVLASLSRRERSRWTRVTAHIAAGHRLRAGLASIGTSPDEADAVIDPSGRVQHAKGGATRTESRAALVRAIKNVDRARSRKRKDPLEALELWTALVSGQWSIVDRVDTDGRRFFVAWRNDPAVPDHRTLTERELQIASYAALGHSNKLIAYSLGLTPSTVATHLTSAQVKLGVRTRVELIELVRVLRWSQQDDAVRPLAVRNHELAAIELPAQRDALASLSPAERAVAEAALRGLSDQQIAIVRGTSPRTIANQLRKIYERLGVSSRAELAATLR